MASIKINKEDVYKISDDLEKELQIVIKTIEDLKYEYKETFEGQKSEHVINDFKDTTPELIYEMEQITSESLQGIINNLRAVADNFENQDNTIANKIK